MEMEFFVRPGTDEQWHDYWIRSRWQWYLDLGMRPENLRIRDHATDELSHYAKSTVDVEYRFPFAWSELEGIANRTDFDLRQHSEFSGKDLSYFDQERDERYLPYVIEPAAGVDRSMLAFLVDAYREEEAPTAKGGVEKRTVLRAAPRAGAGEGRGAAAVTQRQAGADGAQGQRPAQAPLGDAVRRRRRDRPPLPPPGRDRHAVLRHRRLPDRRGATRRSPSATATRWRRSACRSTASSDYLAEHLTLD